MMKTNLNKESEVYLDFIQKNLILLALPFVLGCIGGWIHGYSRPLVYTSEIILQMDYNERNLKDRMIITDQATTLLRSQSLQRQLKLNLADKATIYKSGPLAISVSVEGVEALETKIDLQKLEDYASQTYPVKKVAPVLTQTRDKNLIKEMIFGGIFGGVIGLILSLIKTYLKRY